MRFESSKTESGKFTSFNSYVSAMKPDQSEIYYLAGDNREKIERNPNLEYFLKKDIEVIYLTDPMDIFVIPYIFEYSEKKIVSIEKAEINSEENSNENDTQNIENHTKLIDKFKAIIGEKV